MLELETVDEEGEPVVAVVEVTKLNIVPVYAVGVPVCISRLSSPVLEAVDVCSLSLVKLGESVAVLIHVSLEVSVEEILLLVMVCSVETVEVKDVNVLVILNCPLASWLTEGCGEGCIVLMGVWLIVDDVEVDSGMLEGVDGVGTDCMASVLDSADEMLGSVGVGASCVGRLAVVVVSADEVLGTIDVETVSVVITIIVTGSADDVPCVKDAGATGMLTSAWVVGCTRVDVAWIRTDAVAMMPIAAASAS